MIYEKSRRNISPAKAAKIPLPWGAFSALPADLPSGLRLLPGPDHWNQSKTEVTAAPSAEEYPDEDCQ